MGAAGLGLRLHDVLYSSDLHRVFHDWWKNAGAEYIPFRDGRPTESITFYYDPLIDYHHRVGLGGGLALAFQLAPQMPEQAQLLFEGAAEKLGWMASGPVREATRDFTGGAPTPQGTVIGLSLAREFGNDPVFNKLMTHAESAYEPTWDAETGDFTWGFGLNEPHPRGQLNAGIMTAEAGSKGAWGRIFNEPKFHKFNQPTVYGVDFPSVCLSQAWYDADGQRLIVATDAGIPTASGRATSFRISQIDPQRCVVTIDGQLSDGWQVVDGELEITTTVGEHMVVITLR